MDRSANLRFGPYEIRCRARELFKHGVRLRLRPQPFQVLYVLASHSGEVVTREELRSHLWPSDTFVDFEHSLNTAIKELRGVLGDSPSDPRYIETLPRIGYRFIVAVEAVELAASAASFAADDASTGASALAASEPVASGSTTPEPEASRSSASAVAARFPSHRLALTGVLVVIFLAAGAYFRWSPSRLHQQLLSGRRMLAVLPFENLTGSPDQDYFSDGLTEEMISQLATIDPSIGVVGRTSVMHYKHTQENLEQIGRELGVQYLLEGSVRRDSGKVRVAAQLIQARDQTHIWSRQYNRDLNDLLTLQSEIAAEISDEIRATIGAQPNPASHAPQHANQTTSFEAYDLYLKGRFFWNKRTSAGLQQAADYFQQAIAKDPNYAHAYAGLADAYALVASYNFGPEAEVTARARAAAVHALQLDDTLAEAHTSLALIAENYDWDWETAEKEYRRAIQLNPDYPTAHHWYAEFLSYQGRFDEAFAEIDRAHQLDPLSLIITTDAGAIAYFARQYDRAIPQFNRVFEMEPNFPRAHLIIYAYAQKGSYPEAWADIERWRKNDDGPHIDAFEAYVAARQGQHDRARRALSKYLEANRGRKFGPIAPIVVAYAALGQTNEAIDWLQKGYAEHSNALVALKVDPVYDPLRNDPRFQELLRRIRLAS